jgi:hypothetical protein
MTTKPPPPSSSSAAAAAAAAAAASTARRQPIRQARTVRKPPAKTNGGDDAPSHLPPPKFYPALTQFTDAVDALPSEIIRHFTLLREVDAKACLPEANLRALIDGAERLPAPEDPVGFDAALEALKQLDELRRRRDADPSFATNAALLELEKQEAAEVAASGATGGILGAQETRRARCHQIRGQIVELLATQEEKIHVITTAVEVLQKHLARVEHAFAYVEVEIPAIYRLGNPEHWAYKEPMRKGTAAQIAREREREKREAEAERYQQMQQEKESNMRGDRRLAKYRGHEDDEDTGRKKVRKGGDNETLSSAKRITDQQAGVQQQTKKRKTTRDDREKASGANAFTKGTASPRAGTPAAGASKKAKTAAQRATAKR